MTFKFLNLVGIKRLKFIQLTNCFTDYTLLPTFLANFFTLKVFDYAYIDIAIKKTF